MEVIAWHKVNQLVVLSNVDLSWELVMDFCYYISSKDANVFSAVIGGYSTLLMVGMDLFSTFEMPVPIVGGWFVLLDIAYWKLGLSILVRALILLPWSYIGIKIDFFTYVSIFYHSIE